MTTDSREGTGPSLSEDPDRRRVLFMIFCHQRTGSTLLASRLDSHPGIRCYEEVFLPGVDSSPSMTEWLETRRLPRFLRRLPRARRLFLSSLFDAGQMRQDVAAAGFKLMYDQLAWCPRFAFYVPIAARFVRDPALRNWLRDNNAVVIHMMRRNHLKLLVSQKLATQNGRFHSRNPAVSDVKVIIPLPGLIPRLRRIELAEKAARSCIAGLRTIDVYYEDYIGDGSWAADADICRALGLSLPADGLTSQLRKIGSDDLRDTIANYEAVAAHLTGTRYERFLA